MTTCRNGHQLQIDMWTSSRLAVDGSRNVLVPLRSRPGPVVGMIKDNVPVCVFVSKKPRDENDVDHCTSNAIESAAAARHLPASARPVTSSPLPCNTVGKYLGNVGREISHWEARSSGAYQGPLAQILPSSFVES